MSGLNTPDGAVKYVIGIDLGTSNCAVAATEPKAGASARVVDFPVPQLVRPGEVGARDLLPACVYLPFEGEFADGALTLPWGFSPHVTGELARWQGGRVPGRVVTSAKSWLIHPHIDRQGPVLPWGAPPEVTRLSPVAAQAALLAHLRAAWDAAHPEAPLRDQEVVLTVPASFDEAARALTLSSARDAGYPMNRLTLLEEPQAAFYDFTSRHRRSLSKAFEGVRLVLVVDVGGGTTDLSLVRVAMLPEGPALERVAVGEHLLLGGDNMDAAVARALEASMMKGRRFNGVQWAQALLEARRAKELLLSDDPPARVPVTIAGTGSRLLGSVLSGALEQGELESLLVEGFFPHAAQDVAADCGVGGRSAFVELGLPYERDPAITRHIVRFLRQHASSALAALQAKEQKPAPREGVASASTAPPAAESLPRPDALLLNGGVFNSAVLTAALVDRLSQLWPKSPRLRLLPHGSLDLAVARGAAYSGLAHRALGKRIGGGAPRAYFVRLASQGPAQLLCLVPRGTEEGRELELTARAFQLTLGRPVQFQLYSTTADRLDRPGDVLTLEGDAFHALPPVHTILTTPSGASAARGPGQQVSVHLAAGLTQVGTLTVACLAAGGGEGQAARRWRLEFELRGVTSGSGVSKTEAMPAHFADASLEVERVFGTRPLPVEPRDVKNLVRTLERVLGPKESWRLPVLRELWTALFAGAGKRRRSADHERLMYQLLGFTLRPGQGYPLDEWRCEQTFTLFEPGVTHHQEVPVWTEFWIFWRRIAPGLNEASQLAVWAFLEPHLKAQVPSFSPGKGRSKGVQPQGLEEMVRCAAALELVPSKAKVELGALVCQRLASPQTAGGPWAWALGRLGARAPLGGAGHRVVPPEVAQRWIETLLGLDSARHDGAAFALVQLARRTGDRGLDVDDDARAAVLARLSALNAPPAWRRQVEGVVELSADDEARALGDTLPQGLTLVAQE